MVDPIFPNSLPCRVYRVKVSEQALRATNFHERKPKRCWDHRHGCGQLSTAAFLWLEFCGGDRFPPGGNPEDGPGARTTHMDPEVVGENHDGCCRGLHLPEAPGGCCEEGRVAASPGFLRAR